MQSQNGKRIPTYMPQANKALLHYIFGSVFFNIDWKLSFFQYYSSFFNLFKVSSTIGIKHDFPFINIRKVPREVLKTEGPCEC